MNNSIVVTVIAFFIFIIITNICITISLENRDPTKTISWLMVLTLLPGVGLGLYLLFGGNMRKYQWQKVQDDIKEYLSAEELKQIFSKSEQEYLAKNLTLDSKDFEVSDRNIMRLVLKSSTSPIALNNKVDIFTEGVSKFEQMLEDINNAQHHIHLEYFIIKDSKIGNRLKDALVKKAQQGVKVRIIFDVIGSKGLLYKSAFLKDLQESGCEIATAKKSSRLLFMLRNLNYRNHRKVCIVDGKIGYIGGINIGDEYVHEDKRFGFWRDTHLRIQGSAVYMLQLSFLIDWLSKTQQVIVQKDYFPHIEVSGNTIMQIARSGVDSPDETIYQAYFYSIAQARESVYIETPYFIPDEALLTAIKTAAMAGVDVRIIFPEIADHAIVHHASLSYLEQMAKAGAKIHLYQKGFIHSKVVLVDKEVASVGTANMDIRSFMLNSEINALIYDDETVERLYAMFYKDIEDCKTITYEDFQNKSIFKKVQQSFARLFSPLM